jgi:ribosomal protein S18 acetylase RimI-like enzyme
VQLEFVQADLANPRHAAAFLAALSAYALDPMGGAAPLSDYARENLVASLQAQPHAFSVLAFADGEVAGLANCFMGFSTFACKPLVNIHDFVVLAGFRGQHIGEQLMGFVEQIARAKGCCKITLEVLEGNTIAQALYSKVGYGGYTLGDEGGHALFWQKKLIG